MINSNSDPLQLARCLRDELESVYGIDYSGEHEVSERVDYLLSICRAYIACREQAEKEESR